MAFEGDIKTYAPVEVDPVSALILKARDMLSDPTKWTKGQFRDEAGNAFCIIGAIHTARGGATRIETAREISAACQRIANAAGMHPAQFNDHRDTTHADVLALLDRAACPENGI